MQGKKRHIQSIYNEGNVDNGEKFYKFQVLLPNGLTVLYGKRNPLGDMPLEVFLEKVKEISMKNKKQTEHLKPRRKILWKSKDLYLEDATGNKITKRLCFGDFKPNKVHLLRLFDGADQTVDTFEDMWDLTPDTDLLTELPENYTFEAALSDLIDNSLQAVWNNGGDERKLISVEVKEDRVSVFDSGPGMDGTEENSIVKWGKMGASVHRSSKELAIGGKPPFLKPFFGMYGYGGTVASMHLGWYAEVSAKTKQSEKVYWLRLEREALLKKSGSGNWKTPGGVRDPLEDEIEKSPHGSFTKVDMKPKMKMPDVFQLQCKLKDIYFPYIQCDEISKEGRTTVPVEFEVNGINLAEIDGGEVATTNLYSCNGSDFVLDLHFSIEEDNAAAKCPRVKASREANARLKCVYFPMVEGKENIERILEKLKSDGCAIKEDFENFSRVSVRRLGRLLPDARWKLLPFMRPKQRGEKLQILKRCCMRVKCFIDTDAGFDPISSKTDLAPQNPFTESLKDLGVNPLQNDKEVKVEVYREEKKLRKKLSLLQLEMKYREWLLKMHSEHDKEFTCGIDEPVLLVDPSNKEALGIKSDTVRVHESICWKGTTWSREQKIKVLKGACAANKNIYATIDYFLLEGFEDDVGGEARVICWPLGVPDQDRCELTVDATHLELRSSISLPIVVMESRKCVAVDMDDWNCQLEKLNLKRPSAIEILGLKQCKELDIDGALPSGGPVSAGSVPPKEVVAVLRPSNFSSSSVPNGLDQKYIIKDNFEMCMDIKFVAEAANSLKPDHIFSGSTTSTSRRGRQGLYVFSLGSVSSLFQKAGLYTFSFSLREQAGTSCEISVQVQASSEIKQWKLLKGDENLEFIARAGSVFPPFSVARYDIYDNCVPFKCIPDITIKLVCNGVVLCHIKKVKVEVSPDNLHMIVKNVRITTNNLDSIRPKYEATLALYQLEEHILSIPCHVMPGRLQSITFHPSKFGNGLIPKQVVQEAKLEMFDRHGNHIEKGTEVGLAVHGFCLLDEIGLKREVDDLGFIDISGLLKVTAPYGEPASLSVLYPSDKDVIFTKKFRVEKRELRIATNVPELCCAGSRLKDIAFEVVNSNGEVDQTIHDDVKGQSHTLLIKTDFPDFDDSLRYAFRRGRCVIPSLTLPRREGSFFLEAVYFQHQELHCKFKVNVTHATHTANDNTSDLQSSEEEHDDGISQFSDDEISTHPVTFAAQNGLSVPRPQTRAFEVVSPVQQLPEEHREDISQSSDGKSMRRTDSFASKNAGTSTTSKLMKKQDTLPEFSSKLYDPLDELNTAIFKSPDGKTIPPKSFTPKHAVTTMRTDLQNFQANLQKKQDNLLETPSKQYDPNNNLNNDIFQPSPGNLFSLNPVTPERATMIMGPDMQVFQDLEKELHNYGSRINEYEEDLKDLEVCREVAVLSLSQASMDDPLPLDQSDLSEKENVSLKIESKVGSAAAVYSVILRGDYLKEQHCKIKANMVGLVALLGTAPSHTLSRLLAEYLGEDQMLATVHQSSAAVTPPENFEHALYSVAADSGMSIKGSHLHIFLEDIRVCPGGVIVGDPQKKLALPKPTLPNGTAPPGFLGYAVNMIEIDVDHLQTKTAAGHGLRETLFYRLFGDVQVYDSKEHMKLALNCISDGAVSLDGGIVRGNGIISVGRKEVDVQFPVVALEQRMVVYREREDIKEHIERLDTVEEAIDYTSNKRSESLKKLREREAQYYKLIEDTPQRLHLSQESLKMTSAMPSQSPN